MSNKTGSGIKIISKNRKASFNYELLEKWEAGIVLTGTEIKSVRAGQVDLKQSYVQHLDGELWLVEAHISPYAQGNRENHDPKRQRKLLLHKREIDKIVSNLKSKGLTLVPTILYLKNGRAKVEIALGRGKKKHDKRADLAKKDANRQIQRALKNQY